MFLTNAWIVPDWDIVLDWSVASSIAVDPQLWSIGRRRCSRDTDRCICRPKSTNADVGDELTVLRRCITADLPYSVVLSQDVMQSCAGALLMCLFVHDLTQNLWTDLHEISGRIAVGNSTKLNIDYEHSRGAPGGVCLTPFDLERPSLIGLP